MEVFADEEAHLASWLGKRLEVENLKIPQLANLGFRLVGGRLLPVDGKAGALFMYEDQSGQRLTVMVGRDDSNRATAFRSVSAEGLDTFYWIDGALGYAVTGKSPASCCRRLRPSAISNLMDKERVHLGHRALRIAAEGQQADRQGCPEGPSLERPTVCMPMAGCWIFVPSMKLLRQSVFAHRWPAQKGRGHRVSGSSRRKGRPVPCS